MYVNVIILVCNYCNKIVVEWDIGNIWIVGFWDRNVVKS